MNQKKGLHQQYESRFEQLDHSYIYIMKVENKVIKYDVRLDFATDICISSRFKTKDEFLHRQIINMGYKRITKDEFLQARERLMALVKPLFKIHFDTTNLKQFRYYNQTGCGSFINVNLWALVKTNRNFNPVIEQVYAHFHILKGNNKAENLAKLDISYNYCGSSFKTFKEVPKHNKELKYSKLISKRNFHRLLKRCINIFNSKDYVDFDTLEAKKQNYTATILDGTW